jgi:hypothetical protein
MLPRATPSIVITALHVFRALLVHMISRITLGLVASYQFESLKLYAGSFADGLSGVGRSAGIARAASRRC